VLQSEQVAGFIISVFSFTEVIYLNLIMKMCLGPVILAQIKRGILIRKPLMSRKE
jgi:hypothetical protein